MVIPKAFPTSHPIAAKTSARRSENTSGILTSQVVRGACAGVMGFGALNLHESGQLASPATGSAAEYCSLPGEIADQQEYAAADEHECNPTKNRHRRRRNTIILPILILVLFHGLAAVDPDFRRRYRNAMARNNPINPPR